MLILGQSLVCIVQAYTSHCCYTAVSEWCRFQPRVMPFALLLLLWCQQSLASGSVAGGGALAVSGMRLTVTCSAMARTTLLL
jgi:hypothetical protein